MDHTFLNAKSGSQDEIALSFSLPTFMAWVNVDTTFDYLSYVRKIIRKIKEIRLVSRNSPILRATWRNGSAFGFDCPTVPKGCRFESCGGQFCALFIEINNI